MPPQRSREMRVAMWRPLALLLLLAVTRAEPSNKSAEQSDTSSTTVATTELPADLTSLIKLGQMQEGSLKKDIEVRDAGKENETEPSEPPAPTGTKAPDACDEDMHTVIDDETRRAVPWNTCDRKKTPNDCKCDMKPDFEHKWYRFKMGGRNAELPTHCVWQGQCMAVHPIWMQYTNDEPKPEPFKTVNATTCAAWGGDCCYHSHKISVRNCGDYLVYKLPPSDSCDRRYCVAEDACMATMHKVIEDKTRETGYGNMCHGAGCNKHCDNWTPQKPDFPWGWYRFTINHQNATIPTSCVYPRMCKVYMPIWVEIPFDGTLEPFKTVKAIAWQSKMLNDVTKQKECKYRRIDVKVRNCGTHTVYRLGKVNTCWSRYCAELPKPPTTQPPIVTEHPDMHCSMFAAHPNNECKFLYEMNCPEGKWWNDQNKTCVALPAGQTCPEEEETSIELASGAESLQTSAALVSSVLGLGLAIGFM